LPTNTATQFVLIVITRYDVPVIPAGPAGIVVRTPTEGIPAASYDSGTKEISCGKAMCKFYHAKTEIDAEGAKTLTLIELEQELEVWNMVGTEVGGDSNIQVKNMYDTWFVDVEDCGST
jgi:hypothetical protein